MGINAPTFTAPEVTFPRDVVLRVIRDARFAGGVRCPRCDSDQVHRWGAFSGRQRYRCRNCRRTFSDLTKTAAAYSKKLERWPRYVRCMAKGWTVRQSAAYTRIHPTTSFRWRHSILNSLRHADQAALRGLIEVEDTRMVYSEKGKRNLGRPPRKRGIGHDIRRQFDARLVNVTIAYDRRRVALAMITGSICANYIDVEKRLLPRVLASKIMISAHGPMSPYAGVARRNRIAYKWAARFAAPARELYHIGNVRAYWKRMRDWLLRFRGVATRYLENYLLWHQFIDAHRWREFTAAFCRWHLLPV